MLTFVTQIKSRSIFKLSVRLSGAHLSEQGPGVLAQVRADRSQQQGLVLNKPEHQISVQTLDGQLPVLILSRLGGDIRIKIKPKALRETKEVLFSYLE